MTSYWCEPFLLPPQRWIAPQHQLRTSSAILVIDESDDSRCKLKKGINGGICRRDGGLARLWNRRAPLERIRSEFKFKKCRMSSAQGPSSSKKRISLQSIMVPGAGYRGMLLELLKSRIVY
jgi:hypothetical protein